MAKIEKDAIDALKLVHEFLSMYGRDLMEDTFYPSYHFRHNYSLTYKTVREVVSREERRKKRTSSSKGESNGFI